MKNKYRILTIVLIVLISLVGRNTDVTGIDKYYYVIAIGLDKSDDNSLKLSVQIPSSSSNNSHESSGSSQSSNFKIYSAQGKTIDECLTILNNYLSKKINLTHCSAFVISQDLAKDGIRTYFNTLNNNNELRHSCQIIISSKSAFDVLDKVSASGEVFSSRLYDYLTVSSNYTAYTEKSTFGTIFHSLTNDHNELSAIYTEVSDDIIQTSGIAIFKNDKMVGTIDANDSIFHSMVSNELNNCTLTIDNPFDNSTKTDLNISLYKKTNINIDTIEGRPLISINIFPKGTILSSGNFFDYTNSNSIKIVEEAINSYIEENTKRYLYKITRDYNSDIVGFKGIYKSKFLTEEDFDKIHWNDLFKDSFYEVYVKTLIPSSQLFNKE